MQTHAPGTGAVAQGLDLKAGEEVQVVTTRRERLSFKITEVLGDRLVGVTVEPKRAEHRPAGENVAVPFDELAIVRVTRFSAGRAAVFVLLMGGAAAAAAAVPAAGMAPVVIP
jgi:hypothetical protein